MSRWLWFLLTPLVFALDWWSKSLAVDLFGGVRTLVPGWLAIRVVRNGGGLLGLWGSAEHGAGWPAALVMLATLTLLVGMAVRRGPTKPMRDCAFACMIGGAAGNLCDLLIDGFVTDFIEIWRFPIFNIADLALLLGLGLFVADIKAFRARKG